MRGCRALLAVALCSVFVSVSFADKIHFGVRETQPQPHHEVYDLTSAKYARDVAWALARKVAKKAAGRRESIDDWKKRDNILFGTGTSSKKKHKEEYKGDEVRQPHVYVSVLKWCCSSRLSLTAIAYLDFDAIDLKVYKSPAKEDQSKVGFTLSVGWAIWSYALWLLTCGPSSRETCGKLKLNRAMDDDPFESSRDNCKANSKRVDQCGRLGIRNRIQDTVAAETLKRKEIENHWETAKSARTKYKQKFVKLGNKNEEDETVKVEEEEAEEEKEEEDENEDEEKEEKEEKEDDEGDEERDQVLGGTEEEEPTYHDAVVISHHNKHDKGNSTLLGSKRPFGKHLANPSM
eukprot:800847-Prorocentrum_minimum.AAC.3